MEPCSWCRRASSGCRFSLQKTQTLKGLDFLRDEDYLKIICRWWFHLSSFSMLCIHIVVEKYDDHHLEIKQSWPPCPDLKNPVSTFFWFCSSRTDEPAHSLIVLFWMLIKIYSVMVQTVLDFSPLLGSKLICAYCWTRWLNHQLVHIIIHIGWVYCCIYSYISYIYIMLHWLVHIGFIMVFTYWLIMVDTNCSYTYRCTCTLR